MIRKIFCFVGLMLISLGIQAQFPEVEIDFASGSIKDNVPFDVSFSLKGNVPDNIVAISALVYEVPYSRKVELNPTDGDFFPIIDKHYESVDVEAIISNYPTCFYTLYPDCPTGGPHNIASWTNLAPSNDSEKTAEARFTFNPLKPDKRYNFVFFFVQRISTESEADIRTNVINVINRTVSSYNSPIKSEEIYQIRSQLIKTFGTDVINPNRLIERNSVFSGPLTEENAKRFRSELLPVFTPQVLISRYLTAINELSTEIKKSLVGNWQDDTLNAIDSVIAAQDWDGKELSRITEWKQLRTRIQDFTYINNYGVEVLDKSYMDTWAESLKALIEEYKSTIEAFIIKGEIIEDEYGINSKIPSDVSSIESLLDPAGGVSNAWTQTLRYMAAIENNVTLIQQAIDARNNGVSQLADSFKVIGARTQNVGGSTFPGDIKTNYSNYIGLDVGYLISPEANGINGAILHAGINYYFKPVNKNAPITRFSQAFSITAGMTLSSIEDDAGTRKGLIGDKAIILGAGFRLNRLIRLNAGALLFDSPDSKTFPLGNDYGLSGAFYTGISLDIDVVSAIKTQFSPF